ncbi:hypothetical protein D3C73_1229910 [compost metagenome]
MFSQGFIVEKITYKSCFFDTHKILTTETTPITAILEYETLMGNAKSILMDVTWLTLRIVTMGKIEDSTDDQTPTKDNTAYIIVAQIAIR